MVSISLLHHIRAFAVRSETLGALIRRSRCIAWAICTSQLEPACSFPCCSCFAYQHPRKIGNCPICPTAFTYKISQEARIDSSFITSTHPPQKIHYYRLVFDLILRSFMFWSRSSVLYLLTISFPHHHPTSASIPSTFTTTLLCF